MDIHSSVSNKRGGSCLRVAYILGSGHCGSTLLSILLNDYDDLTSVSEIVNLSWPESIERLESDESMKFWLRVASTYEGLTGESFDAVDFDPRGKALLTPEWISRNSSAIHSISMESGTSCIVDASKGPARLEGLLESRDFQIYVIHLVRDPRAVVHSYDKKYQNLQKGIKKVGHSFFHAARLRKSFHSDRWLEVKYEDLAAAPTRTVKEILQFLNVDETRKASSASFIGIGGNRMRHKKLNKIDVDDRWTKEMSGLKRLVTSFVFFPQIVAYRYGVFSKRRA